MNDSDGTDGHETESPTPEEIADDVKIHDIITSPAQSIQAQLCIRSTASSIGACGPATCCSPRASSAQRQHPNVLPHPQHAEEPDWPGQQLLRQPGPQSPGPQLLLLLLARARSHPRHPGFRPRPSGHAEGASSSCPVGLPGGTPTRGLPSSTTRAPPEQSAACSPARPSPTPPIKTPARGPPPHGQRALPCG